MMISIAAVYTVSVGQIEPWSFEAWSWPTDVAPDRFGQALHCGVQAHSSVPSWDPGVWAARNPRVVEHFRPLENEPLAPPSRPSFGRCFGRLRLASLAARAAG